MDTVVRGRSALPVAFLLAFVLTGTSRAAEARPAAPPDARAVDKQIRDVLKVFHDRGADLYNRGDPAGCYQVFQGALTAVKPLLVQHPELQQTIQSGLASAGRLPAGQNQAYALHKVIEEVRDKLRGEEPPAEEKKPEEKKPEEKEPEDNKSKNNKPGGTNSNDNRSGEEKKTSDEKSPDNPPED